MNWPYTSAPKGKTGTLLLDPNDIVIKDGNADGDDNGILTNAFGNNIDGDNGEVLTGDLMPSILYESELEGLSNSTNILIQALNSITPEDLTDNELTFTAGTGVDIAFKLTGTN